MQYIKNMRIFEDATASKTVVDKLCDELTLACIKTLGNLDLKILKVKTRASLVEEIVDHLMQSEAKKQAGAEKFGPEDRSAFRRNKIQIVKQIIKDIME